MKILHILARALRGGVEKNCYHFVKASPQFHHTVVILDDDGPMIADLATVGATVDVLRLLDQGRLAFQRSLSKRLPDDQFDKIIVWTNIRMPVVMQALNKYSADIYVHIGNPVGKGLSEWIQSLLLRPDNPIHLRPVSDYVASTLSNSLYHRKFPRKVSLKPLTVPSVMAREPELVTGSSRVALGMVARLDQVKDHKTVIEAFHILRKEYPSAELHLVGHGPLRESLKHLVSEKGLSSHVVFHGDVADVYSIMKDWDLFLYGTTTREGLGGTVAEALSIGLPVVATDLTMVREWDPKGQYIAFCKPSDAPDMAQSALAILADVERRKEIHRTAPVYIRENFSAEKFSYNYVLKP